VDVSVGVVMMTVRSPSVKCVVCAGSGE